MPLKKWHRGQLINEVELDNTQNWRNAHLKILSDAYSQSPFFFEMIELVKRVFSHDFDTLDQLSVVSTKEIIEAGTFSSTISRTEFKSIS